MALRLIEPGAVTPLVIDGTTFTIRQLTNGQKVALSKKMQGLQDSEQGYDDLLRLIAPHIASIDLGGPDRVVGDDAIADILIRMASAKGQGEVIAAVMGESSLTEDEEKNSESSSDTPKAGPARESETAASASGESASTSGQ